MRINVTHSEITDLTSAQTNHDARQKNDDDVVGGVNTGMASPFYRQTRFFLLLVASGLLSCQGRRSSGTKVSAYHYQKKG